MCLSVFVCVCVCVYLFGALLPKAHTAKHLSHAAKQLQNCIKQGMSKCLLFWKVVGI